MPIYPYNKHNFSKFLQNRQQAHRNILFGCPFNLISLSYNLGSWSCSPNDEPSFSCLRSSTISYEDDGWIIFIIGHIWGGGWDFCVWLCCSTSGRKLLAQSFSPIGGRCRQFFYWSKGWNRLAFNRSLLFTIFLNLSSSPIVFPLSFFDSSGSLPF